MGTFKAVSFSQSKRQLNWIDREDRRVRDARNLQALQKISASCFSCYQFKPNINRLLSTCNRTSHKVQFYNICADWSEKEPTK